MEVIEISHILWNIGFLPHPSYFVLTQRENCSWSCGKVGLALRGGWKAAFHRSSMDTHGLLSCVALFYFVNNTLHLLTLRK